VHAAPGWMEDVHRGRAPIRTRTKDTHQFVCTAHFRFKLSLLFIMLCLLLQNVVAFVCYVKFGLIAILGPCEQINLIIILGPCEQINLLLSWGCVNEWQCVVFW
jgi:hypothetical protein